MRRTLSRSALPIASAPACRRREPRRAAAAAAGAVVALRRRPRRAADWRDWPVTPGTWAYRRDARGSHRAVRPGGGRDARLTLRCDAAARRLYLSRAGAATAPLSVRTTTLTRALPMQPTGGTPAYVARARGGGSAARRDGVQPGAFHRRTGGRPALVVPAWPEIGRVVEDCRG